jgi:hypothetical protein
VPTYTVISRSCQTSVMRLLTYADFFWLALQFGRSGEQARQVFHAVAIAGLVYAAYGLDRRPHRGLDNPVVRQGNLQDQSNGDVPLQECQCDLCRHGSDLHDGTVDPRTCPRRFFADGTARTSA